MSTDKSMIDPGPMGWGLEKEDIKEIQSKEKLYGEMLQEHKPERLVRRAAKTPNIKILGELNELMAEDGIEGGFSCRHMEKLVFKKFLPWLRQTIGSCVGSGAMRCITRRTLIESFLLGEPEEIFGTSLVGINNVAPFAPYHYRAGRKKGGINGNMDGSFCNAQIEGLLDYGILPCSVPGLVSDAFPEPQNTRTYRQWGANDKLLNEFAEHGRVYRLLESEPIKDYNSHWTAITEHFKPQMICSDWAFKPKAQHPTWKLANGDPVWIYTRDRRSSWAHNLTLDAGLIYNNNQFTLVDNSWGDDAHKNGSFFIIEAEEMEKWIKDAEIMTIGDIDLKDNPSPA